MFTRSFRSASGLLFVGNLSLAMSQGLVLLIIGRAEGPRGIGLYTLALAIVSPMFLLFHLRIQEVLATHTNAEGAWPVHFRIAVGGAAAATISCLVIGWLWPSSEIFEVVIPLAVAKSAESLTFSSQGYWQSQERFSRVAASNLIRAILSVLGILIGEVIFQSLSVGVSIMASLWILNLILVDRRHVPRVHFLRLHRDRDGLTTAMQLMPLGLTAMAISMNQNVIRLIMDFHLGTAALGIFASAAYLVRVGSIASQAIGQGSTPHLRAALQIDDRRQVFRSGITSALKGAALGALLLILGPTIGPGILQGALGAPFKIDGGLLLSIFAAAIPLYAATALATAVVASGCHRRHLVAVGGGLVISAVSASILIPLLGLIGGALAWLIGDSIKVLLLVITLHRSAVRASGTSRFDPSPAQ